MMMTSDTPDAIPAGFLVKINYHLIIPRGKFRCDGSQSGRNPPDIENKQIRDKYITQYHVYSITYYVTLILSHTYIQFIQPDTARPICK